MIVTLIAYFPSLKGLPFLVFLSVSSRVSHPRFMYEISITFIRILMGQIGQVLSAASLLCIVLKVKELNYASGKQTRVCCEIIEPGTSYVEREECRSSRMAFIYIPIIFVLSLTITQISINRETDAYSDYILHIIYIYIRFKVPCVS